MSPSALPQVGVEKFGRASVDVTARISSQGRVYGLSASRTLEPLNAKNLESRLNGFYAGQRAVVNVFYRPTHFRHYHLYAGGPQFVPTAPVEAGGEGQDTELEMSILDAKTFVGNLGQMTLTRNSSSPWLADSVSLDLALVGSQVDIDLRQSPAVEGCTRIKLQSNLAGRPFSRTGRTGLDLDLLDIFHTKKTIRIYHSGSGMATAGLSHASRFDRIGGMSWDGVRLRIAYRLKPARGLTTTLYFGSPETLYRIAPADEPPPMVEMAGVSKIATLEVRLVRAFESKLLNLGSGYDHGRIGAEVAYAVASRIFGTREVAMADPSRGGSDLVARNPTTHFEARMLTRTAEMTSGTQSEEIRRHLLQMVMKLRRTLSWVKGARGLAVLTFLRKDSTIRSVLAEVIPPRRDVTVGTPAANDSSGVSDLLQVNRKSL